jgi:hypothetical protein
VLTGVQRLWIFHRGVGVANATGVLFMQKLDALLLSAFGRCCGKKKAKEEAEEIVASRQGVERISINSIVKKSGWRSLFKTQTIQEATFKEVFLVYRINHLRDPQMGSNNSHGIYVKSFRDIPHADLEGFVIVEKVFRLIKSCPVCYPCKITSLRPLDVVK